MSLKAHVGVSEQNYAIVQQHRPYKASIKASCVLTCGLWNGLQNYHGYTV